ncbi:MAG: hypothetical protein HY722_02660 [Planctomycetes bacterium]|nr:hypothetical protein [Planctomycetota bacterium]
MGQPSDALLGMIALRQQVVTREDLLGCVQIQEERERTGDTVPIEVVLRDEGLISEPQLAALRAAHHASIVRQGDHLFGKIALKNDLVTQRQLKSCLLEQQIRYKHARKLVRVGEILVRRGLITPQQFRAVARAQQRIQDERGTGIEDLSEMLMQGGAPVDHMRVRGQDLEEDQGVASSRPDDIAREYERLKATLEQGQDRVLGFDELVEDALGGEAP